MDCTRYRQSIQELVDGTMGPIRRAELEQHLDTCDNCRQLAADLQVVRDTARKLGTLQPPAQVWMQVAGRLHQEGRVAAPLPSPARRHTAWLALAATLIIATSASIYFLVRDTRPADQATAQAGNAAGLDPVQAIAEEIRLAEMHYQNAIARLEEVAKLEDAAGEGALDAQTATTLRKSLLVIDQAIAESRAALRTEPGNAPARDSLLDALRRKVFLLQDTVVLMNEMRRGNPAAVQAIDGLNKS